MQRPKYIALALLSATILIGAVAATRQQRDRGPKPVSADLALAPVEILHSQPFQLDEPYTHWWRAEQPSVLSGMILVLRSDPELVRPRQHAEPVLYVGAQTAERCNAGNETGNLVVLVPSEADARGKVRLDPTRTPIWFGRPALPEQIGAAEIRAELERARRRGIAPAPLSATGVRAEVLNARNRDELDVILADLIELYSPTEVDLISQLRQPLTR